MASNRNLLVLPGDGIGPEVMNEVRKIIAWMGKKRAVGFDIQEDVVGGAALDKHGVPLADHTMKLALEADAVLFGSVGGPKWDTADFSKKPERGLLRLRKEMDLFANLRPAKVFDALVDASSLKPEIVRGLDIMIIRELTSGVYFGEPRGRQTNAQGEVEAFDTQRYTVGEIRRVCVVAFELARKRKNKVLSAEKANVMHTGVLWREEATKLHKEKYSDVKL
jgi:3-isopropylmalate dehydrogenase